MFESLTTLREQLTQYPLAETAIGLGLLLLAAFIADFVVRRVLIRTLLKMIRHSGRVELYDQLRPAVGTLARVAPAIVVARGIDAVPHLAQPLVVLTGNVASAFMIVVVVMAIRSALDVVNFLYVRSARGHKRPIKGYLQVVKIVCYAIAVVLVIATLIDRSPLLLLSGLGALAAVLMLVFKDTILSLVASVQLNSNDMLRVGDWIEMPQFHADGDVIDIALHTVKVQNWDKTITTIPTWKMINESFKNWRGMQESGGRRIKRSLLIDQTSVRFLTPEERESMRRFLLIDTYMAQKTTELDQFNAPLSETGRDPVNARRVTNIGTFRAYVEQYLRNEHRIRNDMTLLVRQMQPTEAGLPLEIYCFTNTVVWAQYEAVQSDVFDHLMAILPEFGLRLYQQPSGNDVVSALEAFRSGRSGPDSSADGPNA